MIINPVFPQGVDNLPTTFVNAVSYVVGYYEAAFYNVNVTLNIDYLYGEQYSSLQNGVLQFKPMPSATPNGSFDLGLSQTPFDSYNYSTVRTQLLNNEVSTDQIDAYATLPTSSPFNAALWLSTSQQKALGFTPSYTGTGMPNGIDGVVGIVSDAELQAGGYLADWTPTSPANANQFYMIGTIEHETSEVMGRVSYDGTNGINDAPSYTIMDMFRYSAPNVRDLNASSPAYFSINNGVNVFSYWNPKASAGDLGDWAASGPNNFDPTGPDAYLNNSNPGVINEVSSTDFTLMNVLGWNLTPQATAANINSLYEAVLQRAASSAEQNAWVSVEQNGGINPALAIVDIVNSAESINYVEPVVRLYQAAFGRVPDQQGLVVNVNSIDPATLGSGNELGLANAFVVSNEFTARYGGSTVNTAFLNGLYQNVLDRVPANSEIQAWFATGESAGQILLGFANSVEFITEAQAGIVGFLTAAAHGQGVYTGSLYVA